MSLFGLLASPVEIQTTFNEIPGRVKVSVKDKNGNLTKVPLFTKDEDVSGKVLVKPQKGKKVDHQGIKIELIGHIEILNDKSQSTDFVSMSRELEPLGILSEDKTYDFNFTKVEKPYESYYGIGAQCKYFIRVTVNRGFASKEIKEDEFAVHIIGAETSLTENIRMEVGIEECLHIEFEYNKSQYHLKDCVLGKVNFMLIKIKLKIMELQIIKKEIVGSGQNAQTESETLFKYEVMDGGPTKNEIIPIRMFLKCIDLTPTYNNINNRFSVKYFLNLVLIDEDDRRYFKQHEIELWRNKI